MSDMREKLSRIISGGIVLQQDRMHGGRFFVVDLNMRTLPERYDAFDDADEALTRIKADAVLALFADYTQ